MYMDEQHTQSLMALDQWLERNWQTAPKDYQWLLVQTFATRAARRQWISQWPDVTRGLVFDFGCGPGLISQEIAILKQCQVIGYDRDPEVLSLAQNVNHLFGREDQVRFRLGNILNDRGTRQGDVALCRFVAQYVDDLTVFYEHLQSFIKPQGYIVIEDVDDGYLIEYPTPPQSWQSLIDKFRLYQNQSGGDRFVGRKLAGAGMASGLELVSMSLEPSVYAGIMRAEDLSVQFDIERLEQAVPLMIQQKFVTEHEWFTAKSDYRASFPHHTYVSSASVRLIFRVP